jgi:hypothetical protein
VGLPRRDHEHGDPRKGHGHHLVGRVDLQLHDRAGHPDRLPRDWLAVSGLGYRRSSLAPFLIRAAHLPRYYMVFAICACTNALFVYVFFPYVPPVVNGVAHSKLTLPSPPT